jgi:hypothetical protein
MPMERLTPDAVASDTQSVTEVPPCMQIPTSIVGGGVGGLGREEGHIFGTHVPSPGDLTVQVPPYVPFPVVPPQKTGEQEPLRQWESKEMQSESCLQAYSQTVPSVKPP